MALSPPIGAPRHDWMFADPATRDGQERDRALADVPLDEWTPAFRGWPGSRLWMSPMLADPDPVDCQDVTSNIVAGLREHKSQLHVMSDDPTNTVRWQRRVRREWYTIAWPEHKRDAPMLTDLFDASPDFPRPPHPATPRSLSQ